VLKKEIFMATKGKPSRTTVRVPPEKFTDFLPDNATGEKAKIRKPPFVKKRNK